MQATDGVVAPDGMSRHGEIHATFLETRARRLHQRPKLPRSEPKTQKFQPIPFAASSLRYPGIKVGMGCPAPPCTHQKLLHGSSL